jgi:DNA modification methylase
MTSLSRQIDLFEHVGAAYAQPRSGRLTNSELYRIAAGRAEVSSEQLEKTVPIGASCKQRSPLKRHIRWAQQNLRALGLIEKVKGQRAVWELTDAGHKKLRTVKHNLSAIAYNTDLGLAVWSYANEVFEKLDEPVFLALTSPPYPLRVPRAYGNPVVADYSEFLCGVLKPIIRNLAPGGNLVLNLGDVFEEGSPAKSTYIEELILELRKRFGLHLMNRIVWKSNKPPGPIQWASLKRVQLNETYEYCLWFTNDPNKCIADNRRVLEPHTEKHLRTIQKGGAPKARVNGDGAYRLKTGAYSNPTEGRIPRNVFEISNRCENQRNYKKCATELGLRPHAATMPLALARKLVRFLTDVGQLVVDPFGGSMTTGLACEMEDRPWLATEIVYDYIRGSATRFEESPGFSLHMDGDEASAGELAFA